ncbi:MAG: IS4 family transposase [Ktedonobacteraceae bacterium]
MNHDSGWNAIVPAESQPKGLLESILEQARPEREPKLDKRRGRPAQIGLAHLGWAIFWCFLHGWQAQLDLWRQIRFERLGEFLPVNVCDQAVYKRLAQHGLAALGMVFESVSAILAQRLGPYEQWQLAPFASAVVALDESKLDQVGRWLSGLRELPLGTPGLLAGRLSCLFDVRRQQWLRVDVLPEALANSLVHARTLLAELPLGTLLLFDRGYFSFEWFDELTRKGFFWISRLRERTSYEVVHIFVQKDGYLDALVHLGIHRTDQAEYVVRLIQIGHGNQCWRYLTNVLDPRVVSGAQVAQLYRRRWDIELAFRMLKDHLHVNVLWSAKWEVIQVQLLAGIILAQVFHALQVEIAAEAHVDLFEVSLDLLLRDVPRRLLMGQSPSQFLREQGSQRGIIRPHQRLAYSLPEIEEHEIVWPPASIVSRLRRKPHYAHNPGGHARRKLPSLP